MRQRMNIYITTSRNNLKYAYVSIKSLFVNNQDSEIYLYVVSEDLTTEDMAYENVLAEKYGHHILILRFDEKMASEYIHVNADQHWPIGTMSSYWLFHRLLPEDVDRIMVIESDTVTIGDLSEIYHTDMNGFYVACPGPEHKPQNHKDFMEMLGGACLTFVLSIYNVSQIKQDFKIEDILEKDEIVKKAAGNSQMEFTFGLLFKDKIKYFPGPTSCLDENVRYMEELGYDYIIECEKTAKLLHFSSYRDYGKPWNPVRIMPGYYKWWEYAQGSPYYKEYYEEQWKRYDKTLLETEEIKKNISYRNILLLTLVLLILSLTACGVILCKWEELFILYLAVIVALVTTLVIRELAKKYF